MGRKTKQNDITSEELIKQIDEENLDLLSGFVTYLQSKQRSEGTIKGYINDLHIFLVWNLQYNKNKIFIDCNKRDIIAFQNWLITNNENSPARVRRIKSALSSWSLYIESILDDVYENFKPIIRKIENPVNQAVREKTILDEDKLSFLLNYLREKGDYQKACALALAMGSGSRKAEIVRFKTKFFTDDNIIYGSLYKTPETIRTKGRGLGKFIHRYVLVSTFKPYLDLWMKERVKLGVDSEWLFVNKSSNGEWVQLSSDTLNSWAITFSRELEVDFYWHSLRHYFTTALSRAKIPNNIIKDIIGWSSEEMIAIYNDCLSEEQFGDYFNNGIKQVDSGKLSDL